MDDKVAEIAAEIFELDPSELKDDMGPETVEMWDSLSQLRLVTALEEELGVKLSMSEIESIDSLGRLKELVRAHGEST